MIRMRLGLRVWVAAYRSDKSLGTRSRLPWAPHLRAIRDDPSITLPLLEALRYDPDRYVTRSVANHLGDIGKDHPDVLLDTCREWLDGLENEPPVSGVAKERRWLVRHAVRHPAKKGNTRALNLRQRATRKVQLTYIGHPG